MRARILDGWPNRIDRAGALAPPLAGIALAGLMWAEWVASPIRTIILPKIHEAKRAALLAALESMNGVGLVPSGYEVQIINANERG